MSCHMQSLCTWPQSEHRGPDTIQLAVVLISAHASEGLDGVDDCGSVLVLLCGREQIGGAWVTGVESADTNHQLVSLFQGIRLPW